jgi:putative ABC transport system substrate-binding protein
MFNPDTAPPFDSYYRSFKAAPQRSAVEVEVAHVRTAGEIETAIAKLGNEQGSGLILGADIFIINMREQIIKLANERRVPTISAYRQFAVDGSLVAYGPDTGDISRRASAYVDRILRGEQPGNLPVQSPIRYELALNLKTAKALGLSPRDSFLELDHPGPPELFKTCQSKSSKSANH